MGYWNYSMHRKQTTFTMYAYYIVGAILKHSTIVQKAPATPSMTVYHPPMHACLMQPRFCSLGIKSCVYSNIHANMSLSWRFLHSDLDSSVPIVEGLLLYDRMTTHIQYCIKKGPWSRYMCFIFYFKMGLSKNRVKPETKIFEIFFKFYTLYVGRRRLLAA